MQGVWRCGKLVGYHRPAPECITDARGHYLGPILAGDKVGNLSKAPKKLRRRPDRRGRGYRLRKRALTGTAPHVPRPPQLPTGMDLPGADRLTYVDAQGDKRIDPEERKILMMGLLGTLLVVAPTVWGVYWVITLYFTSSGK